MKSLRCFLSFPAAANRCVMLALAVSSAPAAELVVRDALLQLDLGPTAFAYDLTGAATRSGDDEFASHYGLSAGALYSFAGPGDAHGFLVGGRLGAAQATYGSIGHLTAFTLHAEGGYGWAITDSWMVAALAEVGYGLSTFDIAANAQFPSASLSGKHLLYGATLRGEYAINDLFHVHLDVGYQQINHDLSGGGLSLTINNSGMSAGLGITYRLSNTPRPLE
jgi:hypothetical protein